MRPFCVIFSPELHCSRSQGAIIMIAGACNDGDAIGEKNEIKNKQ
jgi:hypothetical protein